MQNIKIVKYEKGNEVAHLDFKVSLSYDNALKLANDIFGVIDISMVDGDHGGNEPGLVIHDCANDRVFEIYLNDKPVT